MAHTAEATRPKATPSTIHWVALTLLAFAGPTILSIAQKSYPYDDPYILLRYAHNLANGLGWQFNPGTHTENAVTSPLYVLLIAAGAGFGANPVVFSAILYALAWGVGALLLARILHSEGHPTAGWIACGLYSFSPLIANVRGMETTLYLLMILAAIWSAQRERWIALGCFLGILTLVRSDGIAVAIILLTWVWWRKRNLLAALPFLAITVCGEIVLWAITGNAFPSTLAAKLAQRDSGTLGTPWMFLLNLNINGVTGIGQGSPTRVSILGLVGLILIGLAIWGTVYARRELAIPVLALVAVAVVIEYGIILRMPMYIWHYAPWTLWILAGSSVGIEKLVRARIPALIAAAAVAAVSLLAFTPAPDAARGRYVEVAAWIDNDSHKPHPTIAVNEIGKIGYYSRADIIDYAGLLDHRAIPALKRGDFTWWLTQHPDYFVTADEFKSFDGQALSTPQFQHEYRLVQRIGTVTIYRRVV